MSRSFVTPPSLHGGFRTVIKGYGDGLDDGANANVYVIWNAAARLSSLVARINVACSNAYVWLLDGVAGVEGVRVIARSEVVSGALGSIYQFTEEGTYDASQGGFPFDRGIVVALTDASGGDTFSFANVIPADGYAEITARIRIGPPDCDDTPQLVARAVRDAVQPIAQAIGHVAQSMNRESYSAPQQGAQLQHGDVPPAQAPIVGRRR